jgi:hypothetical protein
MDISASVNRGSATCEMFPASCVTELNKDLEKAKVAYESEVTVQSSPLYKFALERMRTSLHI